MTGEQAARERGLDGDDNRVDCLPSRAHRVANYAGRLIEVRVASPLECNSSPASCYAEEKAALARSSAGAR